MKEVSTVEDTPVSKETEASVVEETLVPNATEWSAVEDETETTFAPTETAFLAAEELADAKETPVQNAKETPVQNETEFSAMNVQAPDPGRSEDPEKNGASLSDFVLKQRIGRRLLR